MLADAAPDCNNNLLPVPDLITVSPIIADTVHRGAKKVNRCKPV